MSTGYFISQWYYLYYIVSHQFVMLYNVIQEILTHEKFTHRI